VDSSAHHMLVFLRHHHHRRVAAGMNANVIVLMNGDQCTSNGQRRWRGDPMRFFFQTILLYLCIYKNIIICWSDCLLFF